MMPLLDYQNFIPVTMAPLIFKKPLIEVLGEVRISPQAYALIYSHVFNAPLGGLSSLIPLHLNFERKSPIDSYLEHLLAGQAFSLNVYAPCAGPDDTRLDSLVTYKQVKSDIQTVIRGTVRITGICSANTSADGVPDSVQYQRRVRIDKIT